MIPRNSHSPIKESCFCWRYPYKPLSPPYPNIPPLQHNGASIHLAPTLPQPRLFRYLSWPNPGGAGIILTPPCGTFKALPWHCRGTGMPWLPWHCYGTAMALPLHCPWRPNANLFAGSGGDGAPPPTREKGKKCAQ